MTEIRPGSEARRPASHTVPQPPGRRGILSGTGPGTGPGTSEAPGLTPPPRLRRRPLFLALGVLAVTLGALLTTWLVTTVGHTQAVLAVRESVDRGEVITERELMTVSITVDPVLRAIPADRITSVVGQRAVTDLPAGGLVVADSFATAPLPVAGQSLVGVWLAGGQFPGQPLRSGDRVRVVGTPPERASATDTDAQPPVLAATVVSSSQAPDGHTLVTVSVPAAVAPDLSAMVATGRIALVLDSSAR